MFLQLTRSNGDPVLVNLTQVLHFYPLANGQTYFIFSGERFNLTVEEDFDTIVNQLQLNNEVLTTGSVKQLKGVING